MCIPNSSKADEQELANRQIASELVLSERTVDRRVSNILKKLKLSSRARVAFWLAELRSDHPDLQ